MSSLLSLLASSDPSSFAIARWGFKDTNTEDLLAPVLKGFDLPRCRREEEPWAFIFVCPKSSIEWSGNQLSGDLEASAASTYELQRKLVQTVLAVDSSGGVQPSFSPITPSSAVFQTRTQLY
ncbi:hypothetical protein J5N97_009150 [Dioscorea zingiberensis]|uniref:Uncharacterized protein n=1 Tax=Dioscorea zingiberensis TaxID=325984 RepID=A0A9D5HL65_9LILI|nr:hypothetical protein J5N97_009150 [Dioscorea zingiberensis]